MLLLLGCGGVAHGAPLPARLQRLIEHLPAYGQLADMADLGITVGSVERPPAAIEGGYNFRTPANIDRTATTDKPYKGKYPGLYLNQSLHPRPGDVRYLFISDQPEEVRDDRLREDGTRGATGVYARARFPKAVSVRVLMDHTNGTRRPLRMLLLFIPRGEGALMVTQRGEAANADSVVAGHRAFVEARKVRPEPRQSLHVGEARRVVDMTLAPGATAVVHLRASASVPGEMAALFLDTGAAVPDSLGALDRLPTLHSIVWREEAERLKKFIDPKMQPSRFERILDSFQHARGSFPRPDRVARVTYDAGSWADKAEPVRVYSLFESIPGYDPTPGTRDPRDPQAPVATVDNRGKYGGVEELRIAITQLPPGCSRVALLVLNPNGTFGGRHYVTDGHSMERETWSLPAPRKGAPPLPPDAAAVGGDVMPLLERGKVALLWKGVVAPGDVLRMWTEPMANTSVYLWYILVPLPDPQPGN